MAGKNILSVPVVDLQPGNLPTSDFLQHISISNSRVIDFLRAYHLLDQHEDARNCTWCIGEMKGYIRREQYGSRGLVKRCKNIECRAIQPVLFVDLNGRTNSNLSLCSIFDIIYFFVNRTRIGVVRMWTRLSYGTIMIWFDRLREICSEIIRPQDHGRQARTRMIGDAESPIQIEDWMSPENHEGNIDGPWIYGLKHKLDYRFITVDNRSRTVLVDIIQQNCTPGSHIRSEIVSYDSPAYPQLEDLGYVHHTATDMNAIAIPSLRGVPFDLIQAHLDFFSWRKLRRGQGENDLFIALLKDIRAICNQ